MWAIIKKEVKTYFLSPIGYVFIGIFLIAFSISFKLELNYYQGRISFPNIFLYMPTLIVFAILIPMLTMRSFAEERKNGTEQLLLTSPISITKIVLAKFISAVAVILLTLVFTGIYIGIICAISSGTDIAIMLVTFLGFILLSMAYISFGILASSLTENQIISAILTIGAFVITWVLPEFITSGSNFSLINMFYKFTTGQIDIAYTVTYLAFTVLCLILTITVMQRRKSVK